MLKPKKDLSIESEATLFEMFDYLCSKVNWGKSALDSTAIVCMNLLFLELRKDCRKIILK
jgi:hypothetical protein